MELNLSEPGQSRYLRVYEYYKELIVSGQMKPGAKLPSIRRKRIGGHTASKRSGSVLRQYGLHPSVFPRPHRVVTTIHCLLTSA